MRTNTSAGKALFQVIGVFAEFERSMGDNDLGYRRKQTVLRLSRPPLFDPMTSAARYNNAMLQSRSLRAVMDIVVWLLEPWPWEVRGRIPRP